MNDRLVVIDLLRYMFYR